MEEQDMNSQLEQIKIIHMPKIKDKEVMTSAATSTEKTIIPKLSLIEISFAEKIKIKNKLTIIRPSILRSFCSNSQIWMRAFCNRNFPKSRNKKSKPPRGELSKKPR